MLIGRKKEIEILNKIYKSDKAQFLALYGRRRIGKTFLITEFFKDKVRDVYFELVGIKDASLSHQLNNFAQEYADTFNKGALGAAPSSWQQAFTLLRKQLESARADQKFILFFDELPWLASKRSGFLSALDHCWNRYLSRDKRVIIIICGSSASWMIRKVINDKGGLHGRITSEIRLLPFNLAETQEYLQKQGIQLDRKQIIDLYFAVGGVAKYLSYLQKGKSASQLINDICFSPHGPLFREFNKLYNSLFDDAKYHIQIMRLLASKPYGQTKGEILAQVGLASGGHSSLIISELVESGFIVHLPILGKKNTAGYYRIADEYSMFYLNWIEGALDCSISGVDPDYWLKKQATQKWRSWSGFAFESVCLKHVAQIKNALGISAVSTKEYSYSFDEAQIDLVIERADNCINLCEIKYYNTEVVIKNSYAQKLNARKCLFSEQFKGKYTIFNTLLSIYGAKENSAYLSSIDNQLTVDVLFS